MSTTSGSKKLPGDPILVENANITLHIRLMWNTGTSKEKKCTYLMRIMTHGMIWKELRCSLLQGRKSELIEELKKVITMSEATNIQEIKPLRLDGMREMALETANTS